MTAQQQPQLLGIAPELRNIIYQEVAQSKHLVIIKADVSTKSLLDAVRAHSPLTSVCRQIRNEAELVFQATAVLSASLYQISMTGFDFDKLSQLSDHVLQYQNKSLSERKSLHIRFKLDHTAAASMASLYEDVKDACDPGPYTKSPLRFLKLFEWKQASLDFAFHFRVKEMIPKQRGRTITHEQVKTVVTRIQDLEKLFGGRSFTRYPSRWGEGRALAQLRTKLLWAYEDHNQAFRVQRGFGCGRGD